MRVKTAALFMAGSACLLALGVSDCFYAPPRKHVAVALPPPETKPVIEPPQVLLPLEARLPPSRPSRFDVSQPVGGGIELVAEARKYLGTNPTHRKILWCATFMNFVLARLGYAGTHSDAARSFLHYGHRLSGPRVGAIAVFSRGREGGHVGVVAGVDKHRNPIVISGNFNRRVGIGVYPRARVIAYVAPTASSHSTHLAHSARSVRSTEVSVSQSARGRRRLMRRVHRQAACDRESFRCRLLAAIQRNAAASPAEVRHY